MFFETRGLLTANIWRITVQSCMLGRAFPIGFGTKVDTNSGLIRAWDVLCVLGAKKYDQNYLATLLNFSDFT